MSELRETGRVLDAEIAERVLGATWGEPRPDGEATLAFGVTLLAWRYPASAKRMAGMIFGMDLPRYSTDIAAAFSVVEAMRAKGFHFECNAYESAGPQPAIDSAEWFVDFYRVDTDRGVTLSKALPLGICLAALQALAVSSALEEKTR